MATVGQSRPGVYGARVPSATEPRRVPSVSRLGYVLVALSATFAAANGVAGRLVIDAGVAPRELSAVRIYGAALILFAVVAPHLRAMTRSDMLHLIPFALAGFVAGQGLYFQAISRVDIAVVLVIVFTAPLVVALYQRLVHDESLPHYAYGAMGVAVLGLALAVLGSGDVGSLSRLGIGLAVLTMIAYSATVLMAARPKTNLPPLVRTGTGLGIAAFAWLVMVPPWTLPFDLLDETTSFDGRVGFSLPVWAAVVFVVVVGTVAVFATWSPERPLSVREQQAWSGWRSRCSERYSPGRSSRRASPPSRASGSQRPPLGSSSSSRHGCGRRGTKSETFPSISESSSLRGSDGGHDDRARLASPHGRGAGDARHAEPAGEAQRSLTGVDGGVDRRAPRSRQES